LTFVSLIFGKYISWPAYFGGKSPQPLWYFSFILSFQGMTTDEEDITHAPKRVL